MGRVTPADLLDRELRRDGARPLLTWYDDATGERVELSVATAANWAAKIANLLVDEFSVEPGDQVDVALPLHWESAVILLGCWRAGANVTIGGSGGFVSFESTRTGSADGVDEATIELGFEPMGADLARLVASQPDEFAGTPADGSVPALTVGDRTWTHDEIATAAMHAAHHHGLDADSRVLSTLPFSTADGLDAGLLAPLAVGGSVVLVSNPDPARMDQRREAEHVTHVFSAQ